MLPTDVRATGLALCSQVARRISPYLAISRHISPHLPASRSAARSPDVSPHISPHLPTSRSGTARPPDASRHISPSLAISPHLSSHLPTSRSAARPVRTVYGLNGVLQVARIGGFLSPLLLLAGDRSPHVPYAVWGALSLLAGVETLAARRAVLSFALPSRISSSRRGDAVCPLAAMSSFLEPCCSLLGIATWLLPELCGEGSLESVDDLRQLVARQSRRHRPGAAAVRIA